tara:strand:+ start:202 stop:603 length:402 start_codon:yes stop_codon:yes gene_type:complete
MSNDKKKTGRKTRKNRRNRHLKFIREPILDENGKKIGERETQVPRDYKTEQTEVHRTDATVINNPPKEHKPCCESQEKIDKKNQSMLRELRNWPVLREWNNRTGQYEAVIPPGFRRKYRKHMDHFLRFLKNQE